MKRLISFSLGILGVFFLIPSSWADQEERYALTTLLPIHETVLNETGELEPPPNSYLWVQQRPKKSISLSFDLQMLPADLKELKKCTVRIVSKDPKYRGEHGENKANTGGDTVSLKGRLPNSAEKDSVVSFNDLGYDEREKKKDHRCDGSEGWEFRFVQKDQGGDRSA